MTRIAVVQPALELGEVERNLARVEDLIRDAHREHGAEVIVVPEGFTTPNVYAKVLRGTPRPVDGQPLQLLTRLARELDCVLARRASSRSAAGTPTGPTCSPSPTAPLHLHDKDIPTAWEQHFYVGGDDRGRRRSARALGCTVGLMSGWEWARFRTAARVRAAGAQARARRHVLALDAAQLARAAALAGRCASTRSGAARPRRCPARSPA